MRIQGHQTRRITHDETHYQYYRWKQQIIREKTLNFKTIIDLKTQEATTNGINSPQYPQHSQKKMKQEPMHKIRTPHKQDNQKNKNNNNNYNRTTQHENCGVCGQKNWTL